MHSLRKVRSAYFDKNPAYFEGPRSEKEAIQKVTTELRVSARSKETEYQKYVAALDLNRRLWILFASDVAEDSNPLPQDLRARLFYLAEFVVHHTSLILQGRETEEPLVEINEMILASS